MTQKSNNDLLEAKRHFEMGLALIERALLDNAAGQPAAPKGGKNTKEGIYRIVEERKKKRIANAVNGASKTNR